jgi:hypothetical protein
LIETVEFNLDILFLIYKRFKQSIELIILKVLFLQIMLAAWSQRGFSGRQFEMKSSLKQPLGFCPSALEKWREHLTNDPNFHFHSLSP